MNSLSSKEILDLARRTLRIESAALGRMADSIDEKFVSAVDRILECRGKLIITGMGKSGLVGRKIAATLASTGTPSFFLHPGEAFHGDLGMISTGDVVLALSYSGETDEVLKIVPFIHSNGNVLISMTGNAESTLAKNSDIHLDVAVEEADAGAALVVTVDPARARATLVKKIHAAATGDPVAVTFLVEGDVVTVGTDGTVVIPQIDDALAVLDDALLAPARQAGAPGSQGAPDQAADALSVPVEAVTAPAALSLDDALACGLVEEVSSYTTRFTNTESTANRTHNIKLICDILNDGVVGAGGSWSFNDRAGERTAERGFLGAGAIIDNEYTDDVGGGICQVATTIFNAVYDSGLPIDKRTNHSLYIDSYPAGRDAAVSWPDLDLVWRNDTSSDILLRLTYTDDSITATLYGVDPGYAVSTQEGEWTPGKKHSTRTERDDSLAPGTSYVKTAGSDGQRYSVTRTVKAQNGEVLRQDAFYSTYAPITEVVVKGPDAPEGVAAEQPAS